MECVKKLLQRIPCDQNFTSVKVGFSQEPLKLLKDKDGFCPAVEKNAAFRYSESSSISLDNSQEQVIHGEAWHDLPVPMKTPKGVFINNTLFLGGGITGSKKTSIIVYSYNFTTGSAVWEHLPEPPVPIKWTALATFRNKLVLLGGKEHGEKSYTNRVAVWDQETQQWETSIHRLIVPRLSPVVISDGNWLIVAGGRKGSLDYNAEILDPATMRWESGSILPVPCYKHTSTVVGSRWYILDQVNAVLMHIDIPAYVKLSFPTKITSSIPAAASECKWRKVDTTLPAKFFRISTIQSKLVGFSQKNGRIDAHIMEEDCTWSSVLGDHLPLTMDSGLVLGCKMDDTVLFVLGGESSQGHTSRSFKLSLMTRGTLKQLKRMRQTAIHFAL